MRVQRVFQICFRKSHRRRLLIGVIFSGIISSAVFYQWPAIISTIPSRRSIYSANINLTDHFTKLLYTSIERGLNSQFQYCPDSDETRPYTRECLNPFGFGSSFIESLETLLLLGHMSLFRRVKAHYLQYFQCSRLGWVNRHELWSRYIASLIGAFLLTDDVSLLVSARECADRALLASPNSSDPLSFIHLSTGIGKKRPWEDEIPLSDLSAGLPELLSLHRITNNVTYKMKAAEIVTAIHSMPNKTSRRLDGFTVGHYHNAAIAIQFGILTGLNETVADFQNLVVWTGANESLLYPLLSAGSLLRMTPVNARDLFDSAILRHQPPLYEIFSQGDYRTLLGFRFDGTIPLVMIRESEMPLPIPYIANVAGIIEYSLQYCKQGVGFAGFTRSSADHIYADNVQHSAFFGQWLKAGALIAARQTKLTISAIFNERGHLLAMEQG